MNFHKRPDISASPLEDFTDFLDGATDVAAKGLEGLGAAFTAFAIAQIFDGLTGHSISNLLATYANQIPGLASYLLQFLATRMTDFPIVMSAGGGSTMITTGLGIEFLSKKKKS